MHHFITRLQQQTRWQVYFRVLPVVFLAVMIVGAFGWGVFNRYATQNLIHHDADDVAYIMDLLRQQTLVKAMELEVRKADIEMAADDSSLRLMAAATADWAVDLLGEKYLLGVALVGRDPGTGDCRLRSLSMVDSLRGPVNDSRLLTWFQGNKKYFRNNTHLVGGDGAEFAGAPVRANDNAWHSTYVFPPILIEESRGYSQASAGGELAALLPVLIKEEDEKSHEYYHTLYFLSLNLMLEDLLGPDGVKPQSDLWWCAVDYQGRVISASGGVPTVGSLLENQHHSGVEGPFSVVSGTELVGDWRPGDPWGNSLFGGILQQWVVTGSEQQDYPLAILIGHETRELKAASLGYILTVFGVALLALAIAIFGVTRVVGHLTARLASLSHNMEQVAKGDYSRRIPTRMSDEVGRLIGYFNLMAVSLDETQRELAEKTVSLETSLEYRQQLDRSKDDFLVLISHEVRTPLTAIMGGVNLLKSQVNRAEGADRELLDKLNLVEVVSIIESSGERLHGFMNDAIQMTSIQSSDKELDLKPTPVESLIELGLCGVRELAQTRGVEVCNHLEQESDWFVLCDEKIMKLAFEKVLKNAVVHNYDDGRVIIREVQEFPAEGGHGDFPQAEDRHRLMSQSSYEQYEDLPLTWRLIEIFNTGEAIPHERCEALFGKFELVGRIQHHQRGSGLSLPIAQSAVENHGGRISVHSVKLQGNSFYLLVPTVSAAASIDLADRKAVIEKLGRSRLAELAGIHPRDATDDDVQGRITQPSRLAEDFRHQKPTVDSED